MPALLGALALLVALLLPVGPAVAAPPTNGPVATLKATSTTRSALVTVTGVRGGTVRVRAALRRDGATRSIRLAPGRVVRVAAGSKRRVRLTFTAAGRRAAAGCGLRRLTVSARPLRPRGNVTTTTLAFGARCPAPAVAAGRPEVLEGPPTADDVLAVGQARFWDGPTVASGNVIDAALCTPASCPQWPLRITGAAARLRVAYDTPSREDPFEVQLLDAAGAVVASKAGFNQFNEEAFLKGATAGTYTVRVVPKGVTDAAFRVRAKLEAAAGRKPAGAVPMLPNLQTVPPYEFGFVAPANPANAAYPSDAVNPPLQVGSVKPASCAADELAPEAAGGAGATKCLRLTSGPINIGDGPFDLRFTFAKDSAADPDVALENGPIRQAVHRSDGTVAMRDAGTYSFHRTHAHFHDDHILDYKLFSLAGERLVGAGEGTKSGFCPADQLFGDWRAFAQERSGFFGEGDSVSGGNCYSPDDGFIGLTKGWGDVYRWQRPGQYVEFGTNGDGFYVVQTSVDILGQVLELDDTDNVSYAYIQVVGDNVELIERGRGQSPFDPAKVVFRGGGPSSVR